MEQANAVNPQTVVITNRHHTNAFMAGHGMVDRHHTDAFMAGYGMVDRHHTDAFMAGQEMVDKLTVNRGNLYTTNFIESNELNFYI